MTKFSRFLLILLVTGLAATAQPTKILFKFDDIAAQKDSCNAAAVMDYLIARKVKASYGVIARRLDGTASKVMGRYLAAKNEKGEPLIEIWHHGLDHSNQHPPANNMEFKGTGYALQKVHLDSGHLLVAKYLGVEMSAFGAPYNATDSVTLRVLSENPHYKSVMFAPANGDQYPTLRFLNNRVDIEKGTGNPDFAHFAADYAKHPEYRHSFMVLQAHPPYWNADQFEQFKKILDFLVSEKCEFVLPAELTR